MKYNYKCIVAKNGNKMYYKQVNNKWKRITNKIGEKAEKGKMKYRASSKELCSRMTDKEMCDANPDLCEWKKVDGLAQLVKDEKFECVSIIEDKPDLYLIPYTNCDSKDISLFIDLNDVILPKIDDKFYDMPDYITQTSMEEHLDEYLPFIEINTDDGVVKLPFISVIGRGGLSLVLLYANDKYKLVIKLYVAWKRGNLKLENDEREISVIEKINNDGINCNQVNIRILDPGETTGGIKKSVLGVMNYMNGDLSSFISSKPDEGQIKRIILKLALDLKCLVDNNLYYTDLKLQNVLYKCIDSYNMLLFIGDLGSMIGEGEMGIHTYPNPNLVEVGKQSGFAPAEESTMVWQLGIMWLKLNGVGRIDNNLSWEGIDKYNRSSRVTLDGAVNYFQQLPGLDPILKDIVNFNITTLEKLIIELKK
jgi:hypothetical protein